MAAVTFGDAAAHLGHKSRGTLYRLKRDGWLADYLRPGGKGGAELLELEPEGLPTLREFAKGLLRARSDSPLWAADRGARPDPALQRWRLVAAELEAAALRPVPQLADGSRQFWAQYGRIAGPDDPPLSADEAEEHAALMAWHLTERPIPQRPAPDCFRSWMWEVEHQAAESRQSVEAGARWDQARWDAANVRCLLEDLPCDLSAAELRELLEAGRVPADMAGEVRAALDQAAS